MILILNSNMQEKVVRIIGAILIAIALVCNYRLIGSMGVHLQLPDKLAVLSFQFVLIFIGALFIIRVKYFASKLPDLMMLTFSLTFTLVLGEIAIRFLIPQLTLSQAEAKSRSFYAPSPYLSYGLKPNYNLPTYDVESDREVLIKINSLGYRNPEFSKSKPKGTYRILVLGDSFAINVAMEEDSLHTRILEKMLNDSFSKTNLKYEVVNCGYVCGYSPDAYIAYMQNEGFALEPNLVIMQYFVRNDFSDLMETETIEVENGLPSKVKFHSTKLTDEGRIRQKRVKFSYVIPVLCESHLFIIMYEKMIVPLFTKCAQLVYPNYEVRGAWYPEHYSSFKYKDLYSATMPSSLDSAFTYSMNLVKDFDQLCKQKSVDFLFFLVPTGVQMREDTWVNIFQNEIPYEKNPDLVYPQYRAVTTLNKLGVDILNPLKEYRVRAASETLYLMPNKDGHWNAKGSKLTSEILFNKILKYTKNT